MTKITRCIGGVVASLFVLALAPLPSKANDESLIPRAINERLPKIVAGMPFAEIEKVFTPAYPKAKARLGLWSGQTGYIDVQLDERHSLSIAAQDSAKGGPVVHKDVLIYVFDHTRKRRVEIKSYDWADQPAQSKDKKE